MAARELFNLIFYKISTIEKTRKVISVQLLVKGEEEEGDDYLFFPKMVLLSWLFLKIQKVIFF